MKISVIIPALNEEAVLEETLNQLTQEKPDEILVCDGGSSDRTVSIAGSWARVIQSEKGRARQMNAGAQAARGDIYLFLHADTRLPPGGLNHIRETILSGAEAGRFRLRFDEAGWYLKMLSAYTRFHFFSYGDQGFFAKREVFRKLGGFRSDVPFEDIDFFKRLRNITHPMILKTAVTTSARRFKKIGPVRQKWINILLIFLHSCGFDIRGIKARLYPDVR